MEVRQHGRRVGADGQWPGFAVEAVSPGLFLSRGKKSTAHIPGHMPSGFLEEVRAPCTSGLGVDFTCFSVIIFKDKCISDVGGFSFSKFIVFTMHILPLSKNSCFSF